MTVALFQSQGRFFGGCCPQRPELPQPPVCFNRRGDSLGGAAARHGCASGDTTRFNRRGDSLGGAAAIEKKLPVELAVSIAGAILWGVLPCVIAQGLATPACFNRRGDSLGGAARAALLAELARLSFNRRGDSLGGAAVLRT